MLSSEFDTDELDGFETPGDDDGSSTATDAAERRKRRKNPMNTVAFIFGTVWSILPAEHLFQDSGLILDIDLYYSHCPMSSSINKQGDESEFRGYPNGSAARSDSLLSRQTRFFLSPLQSAHL